MSNIEIIENTENAQHNYEVLNGFYTRVLDGNKCNRCTLVDKIFDHA